MDTEQSSELPYPFSDSPSPWLHLKADVFVCLARPSGLPSGSYGDLEANSDFANPDVSGQLTSGPAGCMIIRYSDTPVGPYDEILWVPGYFQVPGTDQKRLRITRIYVSLLDSVYNGRKNWNVPKTLANFNFIPSSSPTYPPYERIEISHPDNQERLFASLDLHPISLLSRPLAPVSTDYIPMNLDLAMPPIPQSDNCEKDGLAGTNKWRYVSVGISGWTGLVRVEGSLGDGKEFPEVNVGGFWPWMKGASLRISNVDEL